MEEHPEMYTLSAEYYDLLYAGKDYAGESARLMEIITARLGNRPLRLLDVACGTGRHLAYLRSHFSVEGLDLSPALLAAAERRLPGVPLHAGDMTAFDLGRRFDVVTCLFSAIGHVSSLEALFDAVGCMARAVQPGGLVVVEPWFTPDEWHPDTAHAQLIEQGDVKIARLNTSRVSGRVSWTDLHHLVATPQGTRHFIERLEMMLFTREEMEEAFLRAGMPVEYDEKGLTGRGLYIGTVETPSAGK